ncbi:MarR family transcriptional regulator [Paenibacillus sp. HJL G12]|uniref:MarR family transcriptional regulator n=1 Tax=Paenibacillus dendrobii TaxID=2691084 RepID=A0A7X3LH65_9BACL|nr:MarR family transcriptional regulator [Paenibacillus dendrobii]MWV43925.1 MarR family transcriptional regulator [Paenibacillus dendrobii]
MESPDSDYLLSHCLYFTAARFGRHMEKLAVEAFASLDIPPSYGYMIITINDHPGITQKELCHKLTIAPSTSTRFIDKLVNQSLAKRKQEGKHILLFLTDEGRAMCNEIYECFNKIYMRHLEILNSSHSQELIRLLHEANEIMEKNNR